ncbi:MAG: NAD-dependent epimerase/dehydratase family protein [Verrucomicrobiaceae bacterium]|nr:MAG: NAD-dependent epimerase/dehydratase family protein [Verrucomicrobiaceae bacterium]
MTAMIVLFGASGYVGSAIADRLRGDGLDFLAPSHRELDLTSREALTDWLVRIGKPEFAINAVGFTGRPNIDGTEVEKWHTLRANTVVPGVLAEVLGSEGIRWGHVSSGCIYNGCRPDGSGFTEEDEPEFAISDPRAGWYARTKWMAEKLISGLPGVLIWRLRIPFDACDNERNYLTKLMRYDRLLEVRNSISQLREFASVAVRSLRTGIPDGTYNATNPGSILTSEVAAALEKRGICRRRFDYFRGEQEFLSYPGRVFRASCVLDSSKLERCGVGMPDVHDSLDRTLRESNRA